MINVKNLQDAVLEQRGEKIEDWENAYMQENNLHGVSRAESECFTDNFYKPLLEELKTLGVTPETTYLYMRGHDLVDGVVTPLLAFVCERLRRERERDIRKFAVHAVQEQNELSAYQHSIIPLDKALRRHLAYVDCPLYQRIQDDIRRRILRQGATAATEQTKGSQGNA